MRNMTSIGIVGTGISGLTLALTLQQAGIDTTVYAERTPEEMRRTRLPNTVGRFHPTVARERALGVDHWPGSAAGSVHISILNTPIRFAGRLADPFNAVDFRVYLPRLLEDYADRGGHVVFGARTPDDVVAGIEAHDLTVVASGRESVNAFFPRDHKRSLYSAPQRIICATLCHGLAATEPPGVSISVAPGVGEILNVRFLSHHGLVNAIAFESVPGGPMEAITRASYDEDPAAFEALMVDLLRRYAPTVHERVDHAEFAVTGSMDVLQGAITPTVRRPYCEVAPGRFVMAIGDAFVTNDPLGAQGANLASATAAVVAEAISQDVAFDEVFCRAVARKMWAVAEPVTNFNNSLLLPPKPHVEAIYRAANQDPTVADAFCAKWAYPAEMWAVAATPDGAAAFLAAANAAPLPIAG
jgi:2-polyprenyl-6-methoxyphenol hydroxylase-like FAD-dependent oxidoreductase